MKLHKKQRKDSPFLSSFLPSLITIKDQQQIIVEQIYQLVSFTNERITLKNVQGLIQVDGTHLRIIHMHQEEIIIEGAIQAIHFQPNLNKGEEV